MGLLNPLVEMKVFGFLGVRIFGIWEIYDWSGNEN
jgi:hypothetical protein